MTSVGDSLRLALISLNELKQVAVCAAAERLVRMGVVKGKEQLEAFLEMAGVDHYIVSYGEAFVTTFRSAAFEHNPKQIIAGMERGFQKAAELRLRVEEGKELTEEEQAQLRFMPGSWVVWSSTVPSDEGNKHVRSWFKSNGSAII